MAGFRRHGLLAEKPSFGKASSISSKHHPTSLCNGQGGHIPAGIRSTYVRSRAGNGWKRSHPKLPPRPRTKNPRKKTTKKQYDGHCVSPTAAPPPLVMRFTPLPVQSWGHVTRMRPNSTSAGLHDAHRANNKTYLYLPLHDISSYRTSDKKNKQFFHRRTPTRPQV